MPGERYLYGDSDVAAERLGIVAGIFRETTRAFLEETVRERPALAIDLGCGPGHTTRLIQDVTGARSGWICPNGTSGLRRWRRPRA